MNVKFGYITQKVKKLNVIIKLKHYTSNYKQQQKKHD